MSAPPSSPRFAQLDLRETALLDDLPRVLRDDLERVSREYTQDFRPIDAFEGSIVECLARVRWALDRYRALEASLRAAAGEHGYLTPKLRTALQECELYQVELQGSYAHYFREIIAIQRARGEFAKPVDPAESTPDAARDDPEFVGA